LKQTKNNTKEWINVPITASFNWGRRRDNDLESQLLEEPLWLSALQERCIPATENKYSNSNINKEVKHIYKQQL
jgi:hypothetical protein